MRLIALWSLPLAACSWVYDSQLDDRAQALEANRVEFRPANFDVYRIEATEARFYWADRRLPTQQPVLYSTTDGVNELAYEFSRDNDSLITRVKVGSELIVDCSFSTSQAWDAATGALLGSTSVNTSDKCAIDGQTVYFWRQPSFYRWTPGAGDPVLAATPAIGGTSVSGFAVVNGQGLVLENVALWLVDMTTGAADWLNNQTDINGLVVFDHQGVLYSGYNSGAWYIPLSDRTNPLDLDAAIQKGGYRFGYYTTEVDNIIGEYSTTFEYALWNGHVIYRGRGGIFSFDLATGKVADVLLDRGDVRYHTICVLDSGMLFVEDTNTGGVVYRVPLTEVVP